MPRPIDIGLFREDPDSKEKGAIAERIVAAGTGH
jgi:hypothetical protein